jgi:regulator of sigma E protease
MSIIIGLHELGHLLAAKGFGMRVHTYMIGFPPRIFSRVWRGTRYGIGALPFGGYVQIKGMEMDGEAADADSYAAKPAWQRLIVVLGGIMANLLLTFLLYTAINTYMGKHFLPYEAAKTHGIQPTKLGKRLGLSRGDKIIAIDGKAYERFENIDGWAAKGAHAYTIMREGVAHEIALTNAAREAIAGGEEVAQLLFRCLIREVLAGSAAAAAGLQTGDVVLRINGKVVYHDNLVGEIQAAVGKLEVAYLREGKEDVVEVVKDKDGRMGVVLGVSAALGHEPRGIISSARGAAFNMWSIVQLQAHGIGQLITKKKTFFGNVSGPLAIAGSFGRVDGFLAFLVLIAMLSLLIAFMNLLPIPGLDGGHALFLLYEIITRRPFSRRLQRVILQAGVLLLITLTLLVLYGDLRRLFG